MKKQQQFEPSDKDCYLLSPDLIIAPHDKGSPPSWAPALHGETIIWLDRTLFDKIKKLRYEQPCDICPSEIKNKCDENNENFKDTKYDNNTLIFKEDEKKRIHKK